MHPLSPGYLILCDEGSMASMTRRFSISLPDDVAAELDHVENASAYVAESIRLRRRREAARQVLAKAGYKVTDEGVAAMRDRVRALEQRRSQRVAASGE
jgi:metal-responsive CopG/Arc/MetJ family transcriptional regulator